MVVKFVNEVGTEEGTSHELPRILYSGTTCKYLAERLSHDREFAHARAAPICLTPYDVNAIGFARKRALFYNEQPAMLIVDTDKLDGELRYDGEYRTQRLNRDSFIPLKLCLSQNGYIDETAYGQVGNAAALLREATQEDVEQAVKAFLLGTP